MNTPPEVLHDQAVVDNGYAMTHPLHPNVKLSAAPAQFDDQLPEIRRQAPTIGQHSREVLIEPVYTTDEVDQLARDGVIRT